MTTSRTTDRRHERGVAIIWTAFFLLLLLGFVAIGVDVAKVMATRTSLQNAADAAALAGASAVDAETGKIVPAMAVTRAQTTSLRNKAFVNEQVPVTLLAGDVVVNDVDRTVQVTVRRDATSDGAMVTHVARVLGITSLDLTATATAKADWSSEVCGLAPMATLPPPNGFQHGCPPGVPPYHLFRQDATTGNYGGVDFPACDEGPCAGMNPTGAATFDCLLKNGWSCCLPVGGTVNTEPGHMMGKLKDGLINRFKLDTDQRQNICFADYNGNQQRVIFVPVIPEFPNGKKAEPILAFAAFFLRNMPTTPNVDVDAEFLYMTRPGQGGGSPTGGGPLNIRLIQ
jgi:Flp pilus assembly protein TadG